MRHTSIPALVLSCACSLPGSYTAAADRAEPPAWAKELRLVAFGGPVRSDVEVTLNGELVTSFGDEPKVFVEIDDLLKPGLNELAVTFKAPATPRQRVASLKLEIRKVESSGKTTSTAGTELAQLVVPEGGGTGDSCREVRRFWAGPPPAPKPPLADRYWLFVTGPPAQSKVSVLINDRIAYETSAGNRFVEITDFVIKGKNLVVFETQPTCLVPKSGRSGLLELKIGPAQVEEETVKMTAPPVAEWELDPRRKGERTSSRRTFRAY